MAEHEVAKHRLLLGDNLSARHVTEPPLFVFDEHVATVAELRERKVHRPSSVSA